MCGVAGILNFNGDPVDQNVLDTMTEVITHRGPDSGGHWIDGAIGLGHRRLSIIDLSTAANQPMISADGKAIIVFNGEIYNYQELARELEVNGMPCRTRSDTEVILNLYRLHGTDCLEYLRGMFAFGIWDRSLRCLFVARDRVGIKPLYYLLSQKAFVFGSEIKAIASSGYSKLKVDRNAIAGFLRFMVVPQPDSIFEDIKKLEPGHYLVIEADGEVREAVYWRPPTSDMHGGTEGDQACVTALDEVLSNSVRYHMVADVPVGAFLSGGLDSSAIVSLMRGHAPGKRIDAFSIIFPNQDDFNEDKFAREVASLKHLTYHTETVNEDFIDDISQISWHLDEPFAVSSAYATFYLAKMAATRSKVVLTGDGGDELFAGYQGYQNDTYLRNRLTSRFFAICYQVSFALSKLTGKANHKFNKILAGLLRRSGSEGLRYSDQVAQSSLLAASVALNHDVFLHCAQTWEDNLMACYYDHLTGLDRLQRKLCTEFKTRLVDEMLMKLDRMTMAHSLEARVPMLDHHVVDFVFEQPSAMKLRDTNRGPVSKYILKKAMEKYLPVDLIYRRKQGFNIPVGNWLKDGLLSSIREKLIEGNLQKWGLIKTNGVERLIELQSDTNHNYNNILMLLLAFESWAGVYQERIGNISFE